jgi:hypothetical protein
MRPPGLGCIAEAAHANAAWTLSGEGAATPNLQIPRTVVVLVDTIDYVRLLLMRTIVAYGHFGLSGCVL